VVTWDGTPVACAAVDAVYASCPQTLLPQGAHTIGVSIADNASNPATGSSAVFVDSLAPTVASGYYPANHGKIANASPTITFTPTDRIYAGYTAAEASGANVGATTVLVDGAPASCTNDSVIVSCPTSGLAEGLHTWTYNLADNAGNLYTRTRDFTVDLSGPSVTSVVPSGNINTTDADVAVYYTDSGSGVNPASVAVTMDGNPIACAAATAAYASCPQSGLLEGAHTIGVTLADTLGNTATGSGAFFVDSLAPSGSSITPRSNQPSATQQIKAQLRDNTLAGYVSPAGQSGVNLATLVVTLDRDPLVPGSGVVTGCTTVPSATPLRFDMTCPSMTLADGPHFIEVSLDDMAGNHGYNVRAFYVDTIAPVVSNLAPSGTTTGSTTITADFADSGTGVNGASAAVYLDGSTTKLAGCTSTAAGISCPVSGLADGVHTYTAAAWDFARGYPSTGAGNMGSASGSFTVVNWVCTPGKPSLSLSAPGSYWASYADYTARELSVNWSVSNTGANNAVAVAITGSTNTNGVTLSTALPASIGNINAGSSASTTLKYHVPLTTGSWRTTTSATAADDCGTTGYTYP
ncbi:MAG: hypothetical protein Q7T33_10925, partial [Dehalococcoidia bacterium]|nr:hypothetical protein [Dehalococcoidia bacterium]